MTLGGRRFLLAMAIVGASVCLALGVSLPIIKLTKFIFFTTEHSLLSTVSALLGRCAAFLAAPGGPATLCVVGHAGWISAARWLASEASRLPTAAEWPAATRYAELTLIE